MPKLPKYSVTSFCSVRVRFSSGILTVAMNASLSSNHFEEELEDFYLPLGLPKVSAPGVEPVPPDQEAMGRRVPGQQCLDLGYRGNPVLGVLQNGQPFAVVMRRHALEALQHLIAFDGEAVTASRV